MPEKVDGGLEKAIDCAAMTTQKCKCPHKSHRGLCLRKTIHGSPASFDNAKGVCIWCYQNIHEDKKRPMVKVNGDW